MSSRDCLVASDECVCLQYEIMLRGEYSSKDYLVISDKCVSLFLEVGLETHKKEQKLRGKTFWKNLISSRDGAERSTETKQR